MFTCGGAQLIIKMVKGGTIMELGKKLRDLRLQQKYSQEEFAKILGINRGTYAQYEIGRRNPDYETLKKIADFYNVTTDYLLGREEKIETKIDIKEALLNKQKKATWGGQELTPEQREILTEFFTMIRDRLKEDTRFNGEKKEEMSRNLFSFV
jgi:transcriptional regulator with XRE-family HTH domain